MRRASSEPVPLEQRMQFVLAVLTQDRTVAELLGATATSITASDPADQPATALLERHVPCDRLVAAGPRVGRDVLEVRWLGDPRLAARIAGHSLALEFSGACVAGPLHESLRLVEALRQGGRVDDVALLEPETCAALQRDHRPADMVDECAGRPRRWGWGVALEQTNWGAASAASFGALSGTACSVVADPPAGVSVALYFLGNVMPDERLRRDRSVHDAVWRDLRIA